LENIRASFCLESWLTNSQRYSKILSHFVWTAGLPTASGIRKQSHFVSTSGLPNVGDIGKHSQPNSVWTAGLPTASVI
jgi:hypothetical protein